MKDTLEKLWNEYLSDECAVIDTEEERALTARALQQHEKICILLNREQQKAMEEYVDTLMDMEGKFAKKAFFKGCEFAVSFLLEARGEEK